MAPATKRSSEELFEFDRLLGTDLVIGADEVGRGCIAGPIMAAAVVFSPQALGPREGGLLAGLGDSKKLSAAARRRLYPQILSLARLVVITSVSAAKIDSEGIEQANHQVLARALTRAASAGADAETRSFLVDGLGRGLAERGVRAQALVKGDGRSASIAAAAVVAKVSRDRLMAAAGERWPQYGYERHAGYPTPAHKQAVAIHGPSPWQRLSFGVGGR